MEIMLGISIATNIFLFLILMNMISRYEKQLKLYTVIYESKEWFRERYFWKFHDWLGLLEDGHIDSTSEFLEEIEAHRNDMMRKHDTIINGK